MNLSPARARTHYRRKRRLSLAEGDARISREVAIAPETDAIDMSVNFTEEQRQAPVTFAFEILLDDSTARGLMVEFGDISFGVGVWIDTNGILGMSAGRKNRFENPSFKPWVKKQTAQLVVPVGVRVKIVAATRPSDGTIRAWVNGREEINFRSANARFPGHPTGSDNSVWAKESLGQYFGTPNGTARHITVVDEVNSTLHALTDLSIFKAQRPRHYNTGRMATGGTPPP